MDFNKVGYVKDLTRHCKKCMLQKKIYFFKTFSKDFILDNQ